MGWADRCAIALALAACGCNGLLGLAATVPADAAPDAAGGPCAPLTFDPNRYVAIPGPTTWPTARSLCQSKGYDLVVFDDGDAEELARELTGAQPPFWTGVSFGTDDWLALDDCKPALMWNGGAPNATGTGLCVAESDGMIALDCTATADAAGSPVGGLCETPRASVACRALETASTYRVVSTTLVTGANAAPLCNAVGANWHVVEINSTAELDDVIQTYAQGQPFWLAAQWNGLGWTSATSCPQVFAWKGGYPDTRFACAVYDAGMSSTDCSQGVSAMVICEHNGP